MMEHIYNTEGQWHSLETGLLEDGFGAGCSFIQEQCFDFVGTLDCLVRPA